MRQNDVLILNTYEQLKSLSDPLRVKILSLLIEEPRSGQQLSQIIDLSRSKIHYHLRDLESNGLVKMVKENKKRNMTQKLYQAVAKSFIPSTDLLPYTSEFGESRRLFTLATLDRAKTRALAAPESAFLSNSENPEEWSRIATQTELLTTKNQFKSWVAKYQKLMKELNELENPDDPDAEWFYVATVGFHIEEPYFKVEKRDE
ncbi:ArsR/SmtB family transcription factor [Pseudalkalibacillus salsuginis]|uniref:ArsR/SmtB family transcription factor n=1 Tax=Pseudalkalibacillus salsuginis TaxID=2910972 RepID=UPI001F418108|nr:transcriptional regulator [Pseudalkalibacillus salsuginis]MCF6410689.1 ArsR family transcriptional regulator [Pseudalkalibacillus salsuginis]